MNNRHKIHTRIYQFVLLVLQFLKKIPRTTENLVIIKQLARSVTSIGANALEADGSETKKEFIHRLTIAKKEAKETLYWLSLISDTHLAIADTFKPLLSENKEMILILSKIIINTKKNM